MRGSPVLMDAWEFGSGIIPAHAGLTLQVVRQLIDTWDHPRACGAHCTIIFSEIRYAGSSPRMRGSRKLMEIPLVDHGIIPAHAGLTLIPKHDRLCPWDHPRACGAHSSLKSRRTNTTGSSPRMRGSHLATCQYYIVRGIIPAHAGLTRIDITFNIMDWDHPRACGAHCNAFDLVRIHKGSSPRMRGSLPHAPMSFLQVGIIPAHAGLTYCHFAL